jgi:digeranylgeranylglycerophospholipid reductase
MEISVIGAGPIGCYAAYLLAKEGNDVKVYERKSAVGTPIQCTGILTSDFDKLGIPVDSFLINISESIEVFSPNEKVEIKQKDYIVCRKKFDNYFADLAIAAGAKIILNHSFSRKEGQSLIIIDNKNNIEKRIYPDILIGADGPLSKVAKAYGLFLDSRESYQGMQAVVEGNFSPGVIKTYFGKEVCPGLFAWIVPESKTLARVGLATKKNSKYYFDKFMQEHGFKVKEMQAGTIPLYSKKQKIQKDNCFLVGDAASYVKATTLGGLVPGLRQAEILSDCIINEKDYEEEVEPIRKKMEMHRRVNKILSKFSDKDWDKVVKYVGQEKVKEIFVKHTRDDPIPLITKTLLKEPRFFMFAKYLL